MRLSPAAGPPLASSPVVPPLFFELFVLFLLDFLVVVPVSPAPLPVDDFLLEVVCVLLLPEVVVAFSFIFVHEATNATPTIATMEVRRDFFIGVLLG